MFYNVVFFFIAIMFNNTNNTIPVHYTTKPCAKLLSLENAFLSLLIVFNFNTQDISYKLVYK